MKISLFKNGREKKPAASLTLTEFFQHIKKGEWKSTVEKLRNTKNELEQKKIKLNLPAVTLCGVCHGRNISKSSGFIGIDIDAQDNDKNLLKKISSLEKDPFIFGIWRSSRGNGLWLLFKINPKHHAESFSPNSA